MTVSMTWPEYLAGCCRINGRLTRLTLNSADMLLVLLLCDPDRFMSVEQLIERMWPNPDHEPGAPDKCVSLAIWRLRRYGIRIESHRWSGYRIPREARGRERLKMAA